jgi:translation initiation factor IF-2
MGLNDVPQAGDTFRVVDSDKQARAIVAELKLAKEQSSSQQQASVTLEQLFDRVQAGEEKELRLVIKADVQGSLEPVISSLHDLDSEEIRINILHAETGKIGESDIMLATASRAIVIGFNVEPDQSAQRLAETEGVSIRLYNIIYRLTEDIEKALKGMLEPEVKEVVLGHAEVRAVFRISKIGNIAGCRVTDGEIRRNARIRVIREDRSIHDGEISSLKHLQDDVREVRQGFECGIGLKGFDDITEGDILECYIIEKVKVV